MNYYNFELIYKVYGTNLYREIDGALVVPVEIAAPLKNEVTLCVCFIVYNSFKILYTL